MIRITRWRALAIIVVVGFALFVDGLGWISRLTQQRTSSVYGTPAPAADHFNVTPGSGAAFAAGKPINVGDQSGTVKSVSGDTITLDKPLTNTPSSGTAVSQDTGFDPAFLSHPLTGYPSVFGHDTYVHKGLDITGGTEITIAICKGPNNPVGLTSACRNGPANGTVADAQSASLPVLRQRVNGLGVSEATVQPEGDDQILIQIPGVDINSAEQAVGKTAKLHFAKAVQDSAPIDTTKFAQWLQANPNPTAACTAPASADVAAFCSVLHDQENLVDPAQLANSSYYFPGWHWQIDDKLPADGVTNADVGVDSTTGASAVDITFSGGASDEWHTITGAAFAQYSQNSSNPPPGAHIAIFLDNQVISAPQVVAGNQSGSTQITGVADPQTLAAQIRSGALPAEITTVAATQVSPTLGQDTVRRTLIAGAIGLLIVIIFMISYYRFPGILASVALFFYAALNLAVYKLIGVTMSLAGLAGFVLSVGMAVDANVLIFERVRDELRHGRGVGIAVETGFRRAFPAIRDSNVSTLLTCAVLSFFGTDVIRGFANTLAIGVIISFFSAILITQSLLTWVLRWRIGRHARLYTEIHPEYEQSPPKGRFDIVKARNLYFLLSLLIIIPGILAILFWHDDTSPHGFRLGLDFAGGDRIEATFTTPTDSATVTNIVSRANSALHPLVQDEGGNRFAIQTLPADTGTLQTAINALDQQLQIARVNGQPQVNENVIGPSIASDLVRNAVLLVLVASLFIALYLAFQFRKQRAISARRFAICTFIKLLHDVFVLLGIWAILGHFSDLGQVDTLFITALLTSVAFSIHDTIVVFDRIRENLRVGPRLTFDQTVNLSTVQTMTRSLNTSLTVVFVLLGLVLFGGSTIRGFVLALLVGIVTGTYSSIFNASTLLVAWQKARPQETPGRGPRRTVASAA